MPRSTRNVAPRAIRIGSNTDPDACERLLHELPSSQDSVCLVRLASQFGAGFFADIWASILIGTICRRHYSGLKIVALGQRELSPDSSFAGSLPGLAAIQLSDRVRTEATDRPVDIDEIEQEISHRRNGILEANIGKARTLVEFDPQNPFGGRIQGEALKDLILEFRRDLELGHRYHGQPVTSSGDSGQLTTFLNELHENAYNYSRGTSYDNLSIRGLRIVRLKAHLAATRDELLQRAAEESPVRGYLDAIARGKGAHGVMEAIVSDFGTGIVDHFLASQRGAQYRGFDRRTLLHQLVHERLSSQNFPGSGLGIGKALQAAKSMRAYVSLRTGEFWLNQSFADPAAQPILKDVGGDRAHVAGTHWQFLWPMGI